MVTKVVIFVIMIAYVKVCCIIKLTPTFHHFHCIIPGQYTKSIAIAIMLVALLLLFCSSVLLAAVIICCFCCHGCWWQPQFEMHICCQNLEESILMVNNILPKKKVSHCFINLHQLMTVITQTSKMLMKMFCSLI